MVAEIIVDIVNSEVDRIFDYLIVESVEKGMRVKVPFGGRIIDGIIINIKEKSNIDETKLKAIFSIYDEPTAITQENLQLLEVMSSKYFVPKALVLRLFLPSEMRLGKVSKLFINYYKLNDDIDYLDYKNHLKKSATAQLALMEYLIKNKSEISTKLINKFGRSALKALENKNIVVCFKEQKLRNPYDDIVEEISKKDLTLKQQEILNNILESKLLIHLLFGVTGSGKTEVYLNLIEKALKENKTAIFLVPEISLTPQMLKELRGRFKDNAAIIHSSLSSGEKFDEWWRLRSGEAKIAIGARSAIFAPLENLGVIIIDEEHDSSYFSDTSPRYSTLDIAKMRANYNNCKLILGSATPSVENFLKAKQGEYNLIELPERINKQPMPKILIADMRKEVMFGNNTAFSSTLKEELTKCLQNNNQAIVFLNRRGYSQHVICQECGYVAKCEDCDVSLTYHSEEDILKCHYCGKRYKMLSACPECSSRRIRYSGTGTEKVVAELNKLFPQAKIIRMDNDTTSGKDGHYKILKEFSDRKADILVGTQMIAKGHNFPSVTLVGILDADMSLHFSDYRSGERTFQLITQVAGRSGRAEDKGVVVLQTFSKEDPTLNFAINYDYLGFFEREINLRKTTFFPPFAIIIRVMVTSIYRDKAIDILKLVYNDLQNLYNENKDEFIFFNKMNSPVKKLQTKFRFQVLMRVKTNKLIEKIYSLSLQYKNKDVLVYVEENPNNLS